MERNSMIPKFLKLKLKNGIAKLPCASKHVICIQVTRELLLNTVQMTQSHINVKRTFMQRVKDFFVPKYITVGYSSSFDNSEIPMIFQSEGTASAASFSTAINIPPHATVTLHAIPWNSEPPAPSIKIKPAGMDDYGFAENQFDTMIEAIGRATKEFLQTENFDAITRTGLVKEICLDYKEKVLNTIIEGKGVAKSETIMPLLKEMIQRIVPVVPELAPLLQVILQCDFKD